jgi:hypothetical protein
MNNAQTADPSGSMIGDDDGQQDGRKLTPYMVCSVKNEPGDHDAFAVREIQNGRRLEENGHSNGDDGITTTHDQPGQQNLR